MGMFDYYNNSLSYYIPTNSCNQHIQPVMIKDAPYNIRLDKDCNILSFEWPRNAEFDLPIPTTYNVRVEYDAIIIEESGVGPVLQPGLHECQKAYNIADNVSWIFTKHRWVQQDEFICLSNYGKLVQYNLFKGFNDKQIKILNFRREEIFSASVNGYDDTVVLHIDDKINNLLTDVNFLQLYATNENSTCMLREFRIVSTDLQTTNLQKISL